MQMIPTTTKSYIDIYTYIFSCLVGCILKDLAADQVVEVLSTAYKSKLFLTFFVYNESAMFVSVVN